ncbi:hypothetical protein ACFQY7_27790 [Actinomadura luteofluorescens]|uniref:hypothetical protein n=1 Tax=Actinomadura luteofluorescens TaxID=46163 RepID=UPI0036448AE5
MPARLAATTGLGDDTGTRVAAVPEARWRELLPDSEPRGDVLLVTSRAKRGRPAIGVAIEAVGASDEDATHLLRQLGQAVALAMEALRSYTEEHLISLTLQRSLLPAVHPAMPGWAFSVRYEPSQRPGRGGRRLLRGHRPRRGRPGGHRRRAGALPARGDRHGGTAARDARLRRGGP